MPKTKIIQVITRLDKGGSSKIVLSLAEFLNSQGYLVKIIGGLTNDPQEDLIKFSQETGIQILFINQLRRSPNLFLDWISFIRLYSVLKKEKPQIVHTHTSKAGILGRWAAKLSSVPVIVHMPHGHIFYGYFGRLKTKFFIFLERVTACTTDRIVTLTEVGKAEHIKFRIAKEDKFISIHNGIELDKYLNLKVDITAKRRGLHLKDTDYLITVIARLESVKGHIYFLGAVSQIIKKMSEVKALIVGDGSLRKRLENEARKLNISNSIIFLGERDDALEIISISDLIVLPSLNEGFGLVLLEAGALGKPVVASKVGGVPEIVLDGKTGILVPPRDSNALAEAIVWLLKNRELYNDMAKEAKKWVFENFSSDLMLNKIRSLYEELLYQKNKFIFFLCLIWAVFFSVDDAHGQEFIRAKTVIGVNSNISAGTCSIGQLAKYAKESNVMVLILTDQALARGEFGIWPFRCLIRKTEEHNSILKFGVQKYLDLIRRINKENPEVLTIPGCEVAPFYWWKCSLSKGEMIVYDWSKQLIIIGLDNAKDYQNLPIISNKYKRLNYDARSIVQLWPILGFILGLYLFRRKKFKYVDDLGRDLSSSNFLAKRIGLFIIVISIALLINNFPFTVPSEFDPYHGDQGILPYQRLIDYANLHHALSFWASIESNTQNKTKGVEFINLAHKEDLFRSSGYTGFSAVYGDSRTVHRPDGEWDQLLNDYCFGKLNKPIWGIGETGFQGDGKIDYIHNVIFLKEFNKRAVLDALQKGRLYAQWGNKNEIILTDFSITDSKSNKTAYMGEELQAGVREDSVRDSSINNEPVSKDININIKGYRPIINRSPVKILLIKNGQVFKTFESEEEKFEFQIQDDVPRERNKSFYRIIINGPSEIITNPIFVKRH